MSEFQHYEFHAIDRPLDDKAMEFLRSRSTRAEISRYSFVNEYQWGDLKGDPLDWVKRFFDVFLYYANWGTHRLILRIPRTLCDLDLAQLYASSDCLTVIPTDEHVLFDFTGREENGVDWDEMIAHLSPLLPVRDELMACDYRALYIGWLAGVASGEVDDDNREPPQPPGMAHLTAAQQALAGFLWIDEALLDAATMTASGEAPTGPTAAMLAAWVETLPAKDKNAYLVRLLHGEGPALGQELLARYRNEHRRGHAAPRKKQDETRRSAGELRAAAEEHAEQRRHAADKKRALEAINRDREKAAARTVQLAKREPNAWDEVETLIATKQPKKYDEAVTLLKDLRDLAQRSNHAAAFAARLQRVIDRHATKPSLMERLRKAGLRDFT